MKKFKTISYLSILIFATLCNSNTVGAQTYADSEKVFVTTDRHVYSPSERLSFTLFIVNEEHKIQGSSSMVKALLVDAKDKVIDSVVSHTINGRFSYFFMFPKTGGIYRIKASTRWQLNYLKEKQFQKEIFVQEIVQRRFFIKQTLSKTNYQLGDSVSTEIHITKRGDEPISGGSFTATLIVDGLELDTKFGSLDVNGKATTHFVLPKEFDEAAYIKLASQFQGQAEYETTRVPIQTQNVNLVAHTEMGVDYLVAGVKNRIVVQSFDDLGNPKDIKGHIENQLGQRITAFTSFHKGMADVELTPAANQTYFVVSKSAKHRVELPLVKTKLPYIKTYEKSGNLIVESLSKEALHVQVVISGNGKIYVNKTIAPQEQQVKSQVQIALSSLPPGVYGVQFTSPKGKFYGRRLYVRRPDVLDIDITLNKEIVSLGQEVKLKLNTNHEAATYCIRVISEQVHKQMKDRSHSIVSWMYLGSEIQSDVEEPTFYFEKENAKSKKALDLLGIVQQNNWRRDYRTGKLESKDDRFYPRVAGQLSGRVYMYQQNPPNFKGVKVRIKNTSYVVQTDSLGGFEFHGLPPEIIANSPILIISKGLERLEYAVQNTYNFYNHGFAESTNLKALGNTSEELEKVAVQNFVNKVLRYNNPVGRLGAVVVGQNRLDVANYTVNACSPMSMVERSFYKYSLSYDWHFGIADMNVVLLNSETLGYAVPFGVTLNYNNYRQNVISQPGPIRLNDKTTYWYGEASSNYKGESTQRFHVPNKNDGMIAFCEGVTASGKVFTTSKAITVQDEVEIFTNIPTTLTAGDVANVELRCINNGKEPKTLTYTLYLNKDVNTYTIDLLGNESKSVFVNLTTGNKRESIEFQYTYQFDDISRNSNNHIIPILKKGHARNEIIAGNKTSDKMELEVNEVVTGSAEIRFAVLNDFVELMESTSKRMVRQPSGCFEQVSSSNYPNLMALKVLQQNSSYQRSDLVNKIRMGYDKLVAYETPSRGFEWFGRNPPHTSLSAYGLLQFSLTRDLGLEIDEKMFDRNLNWVLDQRDGKGGFNFHQGKYDFFSSNYATDNAYVTWVLSRTTQRNLSKEIAAIEADVALVFDAYKVALLAGIYTNRRQSSRATMWLQRLEEHCNKKEFNAFKTSGSIMKSGVKSLNVEVMSLALLASYELDKVPNAFATKLINQIMKSQTSYGFGNTQATALALEALSNYVDYFSASNSNEKYVVWVDGTKLIELSPSKDNARTKSIIIPEEILRSGVHTIWVECASKDQMPYICEMSWLEQIDKVEHTELVLDYSFNRNEATKSDEIFASIDITNKTDFDKPQVVAVIHIPAGATYSMEELRFLKKEGEFDYFESNGDELVFYFLGLKANSTKQLTLALKPAIQGRFAPAESYVYQYYSPEIRSSILAKPLHIISDIKQ